MSNTNTSGPAFPVQSIYIEDQETNSQGMTLRDYFAAKAMQSILLSDRYPGVFGVNRYETVTAILAYKMADAMLKARDE
jgi:hypothetical protein